MSSILSDQTLSQLFLDARTHNGWLAGDVSQAQIEQLFALMKMAPTSANCAPARLVFVKSDAAKARLLPLLMESNREKTRTAPACVIVGMDMQFYEHLPFLFPHADAKSWFAGNQAMIDSTAFRNSSLQGAYLMMAARSLGLDCGPMSGFDAKAVDSEFFPDGHIKTNFLINIGIGDSSKLFARSPRFEFAQVCQVI
jgi:3-hydroxypropanoate dehydrogenase